MAQQHTLVLTDAAAALLPSRNLLATVWRYLASVPGSVIQESPICLCRKIVRWSGIPMSLGQLMKLLFRLMSWVMMYQIFTIK